MYLGVAVLFRSIGAAILVLLFAGCLLVYIKRVEEKEMELRFGREYLAYRQQTPFLIPRFRRRF
jgi:protein-S-isoprenylcysteine O-methyltransferase Ste14